MKIHRDQSFTMEPQITTQSLSFSGPLLRRGFWLYTWEISHTTAKVYYVGRTGDSSSKYASSPFNRVGMHFDIRPQAKGNSLLRRLRAHGLVPDECEYRMVAIGPIYPEQTDFLAHKSLRDIVATIEHELARVLRSRGLVVLGAHHRGAPLDQSLFDQVLREIERNFLSCAPPM